MDSREKILIVDDEKIVRESLYHWFESEGYIVDMAENGESALRKYSLVKYDLFLIDMKMPGMSGLELLTRIKKMDEDAVIIMITAFASVSTAISALKEGAYDYVTKPVDPDELAHLVKKALERKALKLENKLLKENIDEIIRPHNLICESFQMKKVYEAVHGVADTDTTVTIQGESGTGKELVAKAIHINSKRRYFPFIAIKCGALNEKLLEEELLGIEAGETTGVPIGRKGKLEMLNGGTLYLDEIGTISPKMQAAILRVLETGKITRIGGSEEIPIDFRLIIATNEPLNRLVQEKRFREDLFYKLNVFQIFVPPLRDRREDILLLSHHFLKKFSQVMNKTQKEISKEAADFLIRYDCPGNVRELENAVERAVVVGKTDEIKVEDLPFPVSSVKLDQEEGKRSLSAVEKRYILQVLNENNWNISRSAQILEIDRVTLYNKINKYKLRERV